MGTLSAVVLLVAGRTGWARACGPVSKKDPRHWRPKAAEKKIWVFLGRLKGVSDRLLGKRARWRVRIDQEQKKGRGIEDGASGLARMCAGGPGRLTSQVSERCS